MSRHGWIIRVRSEKFDEYKRLHAAVWPAVLEKITQGNVHNYSIYYRDGYLFSYFEYVGSDFDKDMAVIAADPTTQKWWAMCKPCQQPIETAGIDEWWVPMEEVFHVD